MCKLRARTLTAVLAATALSSCGNPYAMKSTGLNYTAAQSVGSIQFTDPKLYRREALISEREAEVKYLNDLLTRSEDPTKLVFEPEIIRELEVVSALSASLGLRFDPGAAANYQRAVETSDLQHEFQMMKLQLQLDQLKHDAELYRQALAQDQTVPEANPGGTEPVTPGTPASTVAAPPSAALLVAAIEKLTAQLQGQERTNLTALSASGARISPFDDFQDRSAYRNLLSSARNAASLDELHDRDGAALIRLYFSATVLPPGDEHIDTLGMLRMEVGRPEWTAGELARAYEQWLSYVNANINIYRRAGAAGDFSINPAFVTIQSSGQLFDTAYFNFPRTATSVGCNGLSSTLAPPAANDAASPGCGTLTVALPRPMVAAVGMTSGDDNVFATVTTLTSGLDFPKVFESARAKVASQPIFASDCALSLPQDLSLTATPLDLRQALSLAYKTYFLTIALTRADQEARQLLAHSDPRLLSPPASELLARLAPINIAADRLINEVASSARASSCSPASAATVYVPQRFADAVTQDARVAVYDVGPTEQAQQVSTATRASEAISLAAAIAGQIPTQGLGMDGNLAYARSAMGRADARERVPLVVSFAEPGSSQVVDRCHIEQPRDNPITRCDNEARPMPAFGWLLGPRMTVDPVKQRMVLEQQLKPYELSVDLTVPGWWPYLYLTSRSAWAPDWRAGNSRALIEQPNQRKIKVQLSPNSADYGALTSILTGDWAVRLASITDVFPREVSACAAQTEILITGQNIWRTREAVVGGRRYGANEIKMLPDMSGITLRIPGGAYPAAENSGRVLPVTLLTPYGRASALLNVSETKADGTCSRAPAKPEGQGQGQGA